MRLSVSGVVACGGRLLVCRGHGAGRSKASRDGLLCASRRLSAAAVSIGSTGGITQRAIEGHGKMHAPFGLYSHAVKVEVAGNAGEAAAAPALLLSSGQLATEIDGSIPSGCAAQAELIFRNLATLLEEAGLHRESIVHLRAYVTAREHFADYMAARDKFLSDVAVKPASTLLVVGGFTNAHHVVEIEMTAVKS